MTEEQAKTKACFRAATFGASQQLAEGPGPHCIASACMAWRRQRYAVNDDGTVHDAPEGSGYCGLAGAPQ